MGMGRPVRAWPTLIAPHAQLRNDVSSTWLLPQKALGGGGSSKVVWVSGPTHRRQCACGGGAGGAWEHLLANIASALLLVRASYSH